MTDHQVTCITKPNRDSRHEHITHIGGAFGYITREEAIRRIDANLASFHTFSGGKKAVVHVVREAGKVPYLRTAADGYYNDNLLALAECK